MIIRDRDIQGGGYISCSMDIAPWTIIQFAIKTTPTSG